jgi:cation diffusion facilitator CzcD-associated flavoprotein CzcO
MGNFRDILINQDVNETISAFMRKKIRDRVKDPQLAEKLIPTNHAFGTRRVPLESGYYEVFNQPSVRLVDLRATPIERITPKGIKTSDAAYELDMIVCAAGFDAITGAFDRIDIRGTGGQRLKDRWARGPRTYLALQIVGFPNMFTLGRPPQRRHLLQYPALYRAERGVGDRPAAPHAGQEPDPRRADRSREDALDRARAIRLPVAPRSRMVAMSRRRPPQRKQPTAANLREL